MKYSFKCHGHKNITAKHKTTLEFTKDREMGLEGDCIIGVKADFQLDKIKKFIKSLKTNKITIIIETMNNYNEKFIEKVDAEINPDFDSDKDIVIRKSGFIDKRTLAIKADKTAFELNRDLIGFLSKGEGIKVIIEDKQ